MKFQTHRRGVCAAELLGALALVAVLTLLTPVYRSMAPSIRIAWENRFGPRPQSCIDQMVPINLGVAAKPAAGKVGTSSKKR